jgi:carnosine N-methyltransferase
MSNHRSSKDLLRSVTLPDDSPSIGLQLSGSKGQMSMVAGDFTDCYSAPSESQTFSVVITTFFLDTAPNPVAYLETIHNVLISGGIWINLGPLAWHFESDEPGPYTGPRVELTLEEVLELASKMGFEVISGTDRALERRSIEMPYMGDGRGMLNYLYHCEFFVCRKL